MRLSPHCSLKATPRPCHRGGQDIASYSNGSLQVVLFFLCAFVSSTLDFVFKSCSLVFKSIHLLFTFHFNSVKTQDALSLSLERCYPPQDKNNRGFLYTKTTSQARPYCTQHPVYRHNNKALKKIDLYRQ